MTGAQLVLTTGEPAGIGPDIVIKIAELDLGCEITLLVDPQLLDQRAQQLGSAVRCGELTDGVFSFGRFKLLRGQALEAQVVPGRLEPKNANAVYQSIKIAAQACLTGRYDAMVTAPVHKGIINDAGIAFTGHTELIAQVCQVAQPVMMLVSTQLRVALITTHMPLQAVPDAINAARIHRVVQTVNEDLQSKFGIKSPRILVCGLNPHAGEDGHMGMEEIEVISPCLTHLKKQGIDITGPVPADTAFTPHMLETADVVIAMYHDQGLPAIKAQGFGEIVNITLGLPIIRTSVDHGTALDLAATGKAKEASLLAAIEQAKMMVNYRK